MSLKFIHINSLILSLAVTALYDLDVGYFYSLLNMVNLTPSQHIDT